MVHGQRTRDGLVVGDENPTAIESHLARHPSTTRDSEPAPLHPTDQR